MKLLTIGCAILMLMAAWQPKAVLATDPAVEVVQQNVAVAYQAPQSSAEALLSLPNVYVLPGSFLYWVKHVVEEVRLMLAANEQQRAALLLEFSQNRLAEGYEAIEHSDWDAAKQALQSYQSAQEQLSQGVGKLQQDQADIDTILEQLRQQLGVQQALEQYVSTKQGDQAKEVGALLRIRPHQTLAFAKAENGALLGIKDQKQASSAAQASRSAVASPSALPAAQH